MRAYDFNTNFSPEEFQDFARDMLQKKEKIIFESFAEGKDQGIDGRYITEDGTTVILQVKRFKNVSSEILKVMRKEKIKMDQLVRTGKRVDRYILALSENVTPDKKDQIIEIMCPYIQNPKDIATKNDFNNWLSFDEYKTIEEKYPQLWYPRVDVLNRELFEVVNAALLQKSRICYEKMLIEKAIFVKTETYEETIFKAQKNRTVIISGEPGVGKTMLAEQVALFFLGKYHSEIFLTVSSVQELYTALSVPGKKVMLYDDFWGSNGLDKFRSAEVAGELVRIIERIKKSKDCILIMTTREYILEQGLKQNAQLRNLVMKYKLECRILQYSDADKLQIYYGHLRSAELTWQQTVWLKDSGIWVIHSLNYNPRVLAQFIKLIETDKKPEECVDDLEKYLECPWDFWEDIFKGLSREAQIVFIMMTIVPLPIEKEILENAYNNYITTIDPVYEWKNFSDIVIELEKTVIRTDLYGDGDAVCVTVTFQNPSVKDFLIYFLKRNFVQYQQVLNCSCSYYGQYIEYLKLLDEMDILGEIYGKVFEKTIGALHSATICFYDKHKGLLGDNENFEKYRNSFRTLQEYCDVGMGRFFQLMIMYKDSCGKLIKEKMRRLFYGLMSEIKSYPEIVLSTDLNMMPRVIKTMHQTGICGQLMPMLEIYMESLMRNRKSIYGLGIDEDFPATWEKYVDSHKQQIADYIEKYFDAELCMAAVNNDAEDYWNQLAACEECYLEYQIEIPESLRRKIKIYETWIEDEEKDEIPEKKSKKAVKEKSIEEIQKEFEDDFLQPIFLNWIDKTDNWMEERKLSPEFCDYINHIEENEHVIWHEFIWHEEALAFLSDFLAYTGKIPDDIIESLMEIKNFVLRKSKFTKEVLSDIVDRLYDVEAWNKIWSQRQLEEICADLLMDNENLLDDLTEAGLLIHKQHWYRWTNQCLPICILLEDKLRDKEKRCNYYQIIGEKIFQREECWSEHYVWEILCQADRDNYEKYILTAAATRIYMDISEKKADWLHSLIVLLDYECNFKNGECLEECWRADEKLDIIEVYLDAYLFDTIYLSGEDIKKLQQIGMLSNKKTTLSLLKIEEAGLLSELGFYTELENIWKVVCEWKTEG